MAKLLKTQLTEEMNQTQFVQDLAKFLEGRGVVIEKRKDFIHDTNDIPLFVGYDYYVKGKNDCISVDEILEDVIQLLANTK